MQEGRKPAGFSDFSSIKVAYGTISKLSKRTSAPTTSFSFFYFFAMLTQPFLSCIVVPRSIMATTIKSMSGTTNPAHIIKHLNCATVQWIAYPCLYSPNFHKDPSLSSNGSHSSREKVSRRHGARLKVQLMRCSDDDNDDFNILRQWLR